MDLAVETGLLHDRGGEIIPAAGAFVGGMVGTVFVRLEHVAEQDGQVGCVGR